MKEKYILMRHAKCYEGHGNEFLTIAGIEKLKESITEIKSILQENFTGKTLRILYSPLPRAKHTALIISEILANAQIHARLTMDENLKSDKFFISDEYVNTVVGKHYDENEVCIFVSHLPDITWFLESFLNQTEGTKLNNSEFKFLEAEFPEKSLEELDEDADLPF